MPDRMFQWRVRYRSTAVKRCGGWSRIHLFHAAENGAVHLWSYCGVIRTPQHGEPMREVTGDHEGEVCRKCRKWAAQKSSQ